MGGLKFSVVLPLCIIFLINYVKADLIVETDLGKVQGVQVNSIIKDEKYFSFMGIPYGESPVGSLRFAAPEPRAAWTDVLNAKKEKLPCTQFNLPGRYIDDYGIYGIDDCLHLSVHTPKLPKDDENLKLPVIVFLYNEAFRLSYNASRDYGPDFFVKEDVILVTISHRLSVQGFLAFEDETLPGNNGIRDVILALNWLKRNIPKFGGDADNFTLMGANGGAVIADILLLSPKSKGLFDRVIMHSSSSWQSLYFPPSPKQKATALAKYLEKRAVTSSSLIKELSIFTPEKIALTEPESIDADEGRLTQRAKLPFAPVVEPDHPDAIITKLPEETPLNIDIPVMIGYNSRESLESSVRYLQRPEFLTFADRDFLLVLPIRDSWRFEYDSRIYYQAVKELKDYYFDEGYVKISKPGEYITYINDMMHMYGIDYTVRKYVNATSSQLYYYTFDYSGDLNMSKNLVLERASSLDGTWGATTGDELCYLFVCKKIKKAYQKVLKDEDSEELTVLRNMIKMWTNFAKSSNPTPPGSDFTWTPATKENKECLVINEEPLIVKNLHQEKIEFWDNFLAKYKAMAVDGIVNDNVKDEL